MIAFCIFIISTMTFIKAQKTVGEKLNESSDWIPKVDLTRKTNLSKNQEEAFKSIEKMFLLPNILNFDENHRKVIDSTKEKGQNQTSHEDLMVPRSLNNRAQIDSGGKHYNRENTSSKIKHDSFEVLSTNIPLVETFRSQFLEKNARNGTRGDNKIQNETLTQVKKEGALTDGQPPITENDGITVKLQTSKPNEFLARSRANNDVKKYSLKETKIEVNGNLTEDKLGYNGSMQATQMAGMTAKKEEETVALGSVVGLKAKSEEDSKKLSGNLAKLKNLEPKLGESKTHAKMMQKSKNDTESTNYLARFRKQILSWQNKGQISSVNTPSSPTQPNLRYSALPLRLPEPLPHYRTDYYSPPVEPVKKTQPYAAQYFKPAIADQSFFLDRPPNFHQFKRQDEEIDQFYPAGIQSYSNPPLKNNSYYNVPLVNYYYPSVSYQPKQPPQPELELTTEGYPPLAPPSQVYQVPSYHYGPPDPSLNYGPPQPILGELLPLQEQKPYLSQNLIRISLNDEQCVMSREIAAEAAIQVSLSFGSKRSQLRNCALMFASGFNIAISSMIQTDQNATTVDLVRQLNLKMFSVQPTGHVLEVKFPWYLDDKSTGLALGDSGTIIITFQPSTSLAFRFLIFSYRDTIPRIPVTLSYVLTANATEPLNETNHTTQTNQTNQTNQTEALELDEKFVPVSLEQEPVTFKVL